MNWVLDLLTWISGLHTDSGSLHTESVIWIVWRSNRCIWLILFEYGISYPCPGELSGVPKDVCVVPELNLHSLKWAWGFCECLKPYSDFWDIWAKLWSLDVSLGAPESRESLLNLDCQIWVLCTQSMFGFIMRCVKISAQLRYPRVVWNPVRWGCQLQGGPGVARTECASHSWI